jgi:Leucine-rich repeat (LRR) protein
MIKNNNETELNLNVIKKSLSNIIKTKNSFAFGKLDCRGKNLSSYTEDICNYIHLRDLILSNNNFRDLLFIKKMPELIRVEAEHNQIESLESVFDSSETIVFKYLQVLKLSNNLLSELLIANTPNLFILEVRKNNLKRIELNEMKNLKILDLTKNNLSCCENFRNLLKLENLILDDNYIFEFIGLENLPKLEKLSLNRNQFKEFISDQIPKLPCLSRLDLNENFIDSIQEINKLRFPKLTEINLAGNPCFEGGSGSSKMDILSQLTEFHITHIDGEEVIPTDREEAGKFNNK